MDVVEVLRRLGGVAEYGELLGPCSEWQVRRAATDGRITRLRRNRYGLVDVGAHRAAAVAAGGVLSHLSAAVAWGWKVQHEPERPWVTLARNRRRPVGDLEVRWSDVPDRDVRHHITRPLRTVIDCTKALPFDEALAVADSALRSGEVDRHQLLLAAEASSRTGRSRAIAVVDAADAGAANPFESTLRAVALQVPGLTVETQGEVEGVGFVDLLDRRLGIVVEGESFEFHGTLPGLRRDVKRYTAMTRRGLSVVRFLWEEAMFDQDYVHAALMDAVALRSCGGGPLDSAGSSTHGWQL
ncbi:hypothetical protein IEQ44_09000 [Nocardioides sp. Y6]|uniref:Transcriptional regulator, AbiEi antitoxin, Type IV TA system n=1 Tax=Nocardioides malaquae TaxID=2773426 RepID=A0ABR9RT79_9ACTN|nr:hypothetical protein [Nocardioides malaquae]MBE7324790.1 hypothetical protein [Nocardioides malaquae]